MKKQLAELLKQRNRAFEASKAIVDKIESEDRAWTDEETQAYDKAIAEITKLDERADRLEQQAALDARKLPDDFDDADPADKQPGDKKESRIQDEDLDQEQREFRAWSKKRLGIAVDFNDSDQDRAFNRWLKIGERKLTGEEQRALQMDSDEAGGYTVAPQRFVARLIKFVDDFVFIRGLATVDTLTGAHSIGYPQLDADPADSDWTSELGTGSEDSTMDFGKREQKPHPLAKRIKVSRTLMRHSSLDMEGLVAQRLGYKFGVTEEKGFLTGTGAAQPLGVFTVAAEGITTSRDVSTGNTTTSITFDGLKEAKYNQKAQYWPRLNWIFHRDALKQIAKLKDGEGQYQWQPSTQVGQPDRLLSFPFRMSEFAPNTFTTGQYVGILGDFSWYYITDSLSFTLQRLDELYAETNQVGFIGRLETDGAPVLEEAFTRVTLA